MILPFRGTIGARAHQQALADVQAAAITTDPDDVTKAISGLDCELLGHVDPSLAVVAGD